MSPTAAELIRQAAQLASRDRRLASAMHGEAAVSEPSALERALVDATVALDRMQAPYALIGGLAVAVHSGQPRATIAVGLAVRSDVDREQAIEAFVQAGFALRGRFERSINLAAVGARRSATAPTSSCCAATCRTRTRAGSPVRRPARSGAVSASRRPVPPSPARRRRARRPRAVPPARGPA
jgi:hypothetical protein